MLYVTGVRAVLQDALGVLEATGVPKLQGGYALVRVVATLVGGTRYIDVTGLGLLPDGLLNSWVVVIEPIIVVVEPVEAVVVETVK